MWDKHDWEQFFDITQRRWQRHPPPWPVAPSGANRLLPVVGFSLSELDEVGINSQVAERLGLPVDAARVGGYGTTILIFVAVLFVNLFGAALAISRRFFLKNTGRKLSHLDKQFNVSHADMPVPMNEEDFN